MYPFIKRCVDILAGIFGLVILIPLSLLLKLAFLCTGDKGSIFYQQERIGKDGKVFRILKYRSMVLHADQMLDELFKDEECRKEWEENQKLDDDPRITPAGRWLRKTSFDELPQLLNVLKGDMSLVGPRPLVEGELEAHGGNRRYWKVKPGITGWWASHGRSDLDYQERLELEYYYIDNLSLKTDLVCIFRTIIAVFAQKGAK